MLIKDSAFNNNKPLSLGFVSKNNIGIQIILSEKLDFAKIQLKCVDFSTMCNSICDDY